jgi:hypothetical protein
LASARGGLEGTARAGPRSPRQQGRGYRARGGLEGPARAGPGAPRLARRAAHASRARQWSYGCLGSQRSSAGRRRRAWHTIIGECSRLLGRGLQQRVRS